MNVTKRTRQNGCIVGWKGQARDSALLGLLTTSKNLSRSADFLDI